MLIFRSEEVNVNLISLQPVSMLAPAKYSSQVDTQLSAVKILKFPTSQILTFLHFQNWLNSQISQIIHFLKFLQISQIPKILKCLNSEFSSFSNFLNS